MHMRMGATAAVLTIAVAVVSAQTGPRDVSLVVSNAIVVTMDPSERVIQNGAVAVDGPDIAGVDTTDAIRKQFRSAETIDADGQIVMPGLINTHTHAPMVMFRGLADDLRADGVAEQIHLPGRGQDRVARDGPRGHPPGGARDDPVRARRPTPTCTTSRRKSRRRRRTAGLRGVLGQTIIQFPVADAKTPADALARAETFIDEFKGDPLITPAVAPHAMYTLDGPTLTRRTRAGAPQRRADDHSPRRDARRGQ